MMTADDHRLIQGIADNMNKRVDEIVEGVYNRMNNTIEKNALAMQEVAVAISEVKGDIKTLPCKEDKECEPMAKHFKAEHTITKKGLAIRIIVGIGISVGTLLTILQILGIIHIIPVK